MPEEITVPTIPQPITNVARIRLATTKEQNAWRSLLAHHKSACKWLDVAGILLTNVYTTYRFAAENGVSLSPMSPDMESDYYDARDSFDKSKRAIRGVKDRVYGIRITGNDLDIMKSQEEPEQVSGLGGIILPIVVGVIILAGAIGAAIWQSRVAQKVANQYRKLLFDTNKIFCADPSSDLCEKWEAYKLKNNYTKNETLADSLSKGIRAVGGGIGKAVFLIGAVFALTMFWRKTR